MLILVTIYFLTLVITHRTKNDNKNADIERLERGFVHELGQIPEDIPVDLQNLSVIFMKP